MWTIFYVLTIISWATWIIPHRHRSCCWRLAIVRKSSVYAMVHSVCIYPSADYHLLVLSAARARKPFRNFNCFHSMIASVCERSTTIRHSFIFISFLPCIRINKSSIENIYLLTNDFNCSNKFEKRTTVCPTRIHESRVRASAQVSTLANGTGQQSSRLDMSGYKRTELKTKKSAAPHTHKYKWEINIVKTINQRWQATVITSHAQRTQPTRKNFICPSMIADCVCVCV